MIRAYNLAVILLILALVLMSFMLRIYRLAEAPPGLFFDEGANGMDALRILQGEHAVFFSENNGREGLIMYLAAGAILVWGKTIWAVRFPAQLAFWRSFGLDSNSLRRKRALTVGGLYCWLLSPRLPWPARSA
jgi:hypothetical protein